MSDVGRRAMKTGKTRRAVLGVGAGSVGALWLAACGGQPATTTGGTKERATIRVATRTSYDPGAWQVVSEQDEQANVRVETEQLDSDTAPYGRKLLPLAAADSLPDLMYVHPNFFSSIASRKILADHEKLGAKEKFDFKGIQKELTDSNRWTDGKLYAVPY